MLKFIKNLSKLESFPQLLVLISFLVTFGITRSITHLQKAGLLPNQQGSLHIHHLVPGIFLLLISGYMGISFWSKEKIRLIVSILFGIGAALTIDEFALWLYLKDVYWEKQGRDSVDAVIIVATLFAIAYVISSMHKHSFIHKIKYWLLDRIRK